MTTIWRTGRAAVPGGPAWIAGARVLGVVPVTISDEAPGRATTLDSESAGLNNAWLAGSMAQASGQPHPRGLQLLPAATARWSIVSAHGEGRANSGLLKARLPKRGLASPVG